MKDKVYYDGQWFTKEELKSAKTFIMEVIEQLESDWNELNKEEEKILHNYKIGLENVKEAEKQLEEEE